MSILGIGGGVRNCMCERVPEYRDCKVAFSSFSGTLVTKGACGPTYPLSVDVGLKIEDSFAVCSMPGSNVIFANFPERKVRGKCF